MKRRVTNSFFCFVLCLTSLFVFSNCSDIVFDTEIKFNQSLNEQVENDTTVTVSFYADDPGDPTVPTTVYSAKKYKLGTLLTADNLPNSNTDNEMASWKPGFVIRAWKVYYSGAVTIEKEGDFVKSFLACADGVMLYPVWSTAKTLTLMDGCSGASAGKEFSGNYSSTIKFWTGENVKLPKTEAVFVSGQNEVEFDGWYKDANLSTPAGLTSDSEGNYFWQTQDSTVDTTLYAKWKYKYVYVDPQNSASTDDNSGIDSTKPLKTIAEAKKYLVNALGDASDPPAVKLMSGYGNSFHDFDEFNNLTTAQYNNAILSRYPGFKGAFFHNTENTTIENITIDGGKIADCLPIFSTIVSTTKLKNVVVQNNYTSSYYPSVISDSSAHLTIENCKFINNKTTASGMNGSVIRTSANATFKNTEIKGNDGNGIAVIVTSDNDYPTSIENCTISGNTGYGIIAEGGDFSNYKTLNITVKDSSKITDNTEGNVKLINKTKDVNLIVYSGVIFDSSKYIELTNGATIQIAEDLTVSSPATYIAKIYSNDYGNNPTVLKGSGTFVADNYTKFACAHSGYGINSEGKIVPIGSISIGIDNPSGFTEIDLGDLAVTQVNRVENGQTTLRFYLNNSVADKLASWGIPGTDPEETAHPIQYMIDSKYGCVQAEYDSGTGKWYADIVISIRGGADDGKIPNIFQENHGAWNPLDCTKGLHTLQIYSEAKEANAVVTKKTYNIVVK